MTPLIPPNRTIMVRLKMRDFIIIVRTKKKPRLASTEITPPLTNPLVKIPKMEVGRQFFSLIITLKQQHLTPSKPLLFNKPSIFFKKIML